MSRSRKPPTPSVADLVADLEKHGGTIRPWHQARGATFAKAVLIPALESGRVAIDPDGSLRLVKQAKAQRE
jgi:hypothetical protein